MLRLQKAFSQKNINCSIAESIKRFQPVMEAAKHADLPVRGYVSCVVECPYEGAVRPENTAMVAEKLLAMGCYEVSLGDTIGKGTPDSISRMLDQVLEVVPADQLAGHYHDTGGLALENITVSLERGLRTFDAAVGGLGGCPYAPGAKGNVATGAVIDHLEAHGFETGVDTGKLAKAEQFVQQIAGTSV